MTYLAYIGAALLAAPAAPAQSQDVSRFALVIGENGSNNPKVPDLHYADDDAIATHELLVQAGVESRLLVALDADSARLHPGLAVAAAPTREALLATWQELRQEMLAAAAQNGKTELFFFYSGHGDVEHGEGYITLGKGRLSRSDLVELLAASPAATNHVIVDACKSYFLVFDKGPGGKRSPFARGFAARPTDFGQTGFVLSTSSDRDSHEWERYQAGVFSHEVRSALRGAADVDNDARITYAELGAFLATANATIPNPSYRPDFVVRPPGEAPGDLTAPVLSWGPGDTLALDVRDLGHVYVESDIGVRLADSHGGAEQTLTLRLPGERPLFVRKVAEAQEYVVRMRGAVALSSLTATPSAVARKGALHLAFEQLFAQPFAYDRVVSYRDSFLRQAGQLDLEVGITRYDVQEVSGWTAVTAGGLGVAASGYALVRYIQAQDATQAQRARLNDEIGTANMVAIILYGVAGAAASTWITARLWPEE